MTSETHPECRTAADIVRRDGLPGVVVGTYEQLDVRMRPRGAPVYRGHAVVRLDDDTLVTLEPMWKPEAIRPPDEIARFDGQRVGVRGTVLASAPEPDEPSASIVGPCVSPVDTIEAR